MFYLAIDALEQAFHQPIRCDQQFVKVRFSIVRRQQVEDLGGLGCEVFTGRNQAEVGVESSRYVVVVSVPKCT